MKFRLIEDFATKSELPLIPDKDLFNLKLYFISKNKSLKEIHPRLPKSMALDDMENTSVKRICLAPSIDQCVKAIGQPNTDYYVYIPKGSLAGHKIYKCTPHEVMDSYATDEYWCLDDLDLYLVAKIHTQKDLVLLGSEKYGWGLKYKMVDALGEDVPYYNILEDYALCNHIKYDKARTTEKVAELEFKSEKDAKEFFNKVKKDLNEALLSIVDNVVQYVAY